MTALEQKLLDTIQDAFPLEERPYKVLADLLGSGEQAVFDTVEGLRKSGVIRRIGGIYDSKRLGFISRLCAGKVLDIDQFAAVVNEIPAITHNYVRSHEYNVWFTVIAENEADIQNVVDEICSKTDLHDVHVLLATKKFKINTVMGAGLAERRKTKDERDFVRSERSESKNLMQTQSSVRILTDSDRNRIRIACDDIPHTLTPFTDWNVALEGLQEDLSAKRMRRFGAILRHQQAGFAYNAMVCFNTAGRSGEILAKNPHISHCYERPAFNGFPYNMYAMMHAQSAEDLEQFIKEAADSIGNPDFVALHSLKELKKTSYRFFQ